MSIQAVIELLNEMQRDAVFAGYAIGGAVGATFYLEPVATMDVDVFVAFRPEPGRAIINPQPLFRYLVSRGYTMDGEYVMVSGWPVQFLPSTGPLMDEALEEAVTTDVEGTPTRVFSAEHLAAICLETGRPKDKARLLQFIESGVLDAERFQDIVERHGLAGAWARFCRQFLEDAA